VRTTRRRGHEGQRSGDFLASRVPISRIARLSSAWRTFSPSTRAGARPPHLLGNLATRPCRPAIRATLEGGARVAHRMSRACMWSWSPSTLGCGLHTGLDGLATREVWPSHFSGAANAALSAPWCGAPGRGQYGSCFSGRLAV
jgi:hypothetical protein